MARETVLKIRLEDKVSQPAKAAAKSVSLLEKHLRMVNRLLKGHDRAVGKTARLYSSMAKSLGRVNRQSKGMARISRQNARTLRSMDAKRPRRFAVALVGVARAYDKISRAALRAARRIQAAARAMGSAARQARVAGRAMGKASRQAGGGKKGRGGSLLGGTPLGFIAKGAAVAGLAGAAAVGLASKQIYDTEKRMESLQLAFSKLKEPRGMELAAKTANELGRGILETGDAIRNLRARGFKIADAIEFAKLATDLEVVGIAADKTKSILQQIAKVQTQGKLQGDELMIMAEAGLNVGAVYERLAEKLGKTTSEIVKMQGKGELTAKVVLPEIKRAMMDIAGVDVAGGAAAEFMKTLPGSVRAAGGAFSNLKTRIVQALGKSRGFTRVFKRIKEALDGISGKGVKNLADAFAKVIDVVEVAVRLSGRFFKGFSEGLGAGDLKTKSLLDNIDELLPAAEKFGKEFGEGLTKALGTIEDLITQVSVLIAKLETAFAVGSFIFDPGGTIVKSAAGAPTEDSSGAAIAARTASEAAFNPLSTIGAIIGDIQAGNAERMTALLGADSGKGLVDGYKKEMDQHSPSKVMMRLGEQSASSLVGGVGSGIDESKAKLKASTQGMAGASIGGAAAAMGGGGGGGGGDGGGPTVITVAPNISINGAASPEEIAAEVKRLTVSELAVALKMVAVNAGAA